MFTFLFHKVFGTKNERYIKGKLSLVASINALEASMQELKDADFPRKMAEYKEQLANGASLDSLLPEVFALTREASVRTLGMRHFDVQLVGGMTLHSGKIAEMRTGEGKTLVATLPVVLNALEGKGVHVVTVNDYLAQRDAAWMGQLYTFLGLSVGVIVHDISDADRAAAYRADITYGTNNEFGFDYLRDNMKFYQADLVQRKHNFAIVDEVDSILIDEARTPLIISGATDDTTDLYIKVDKVIPHLIATDDYTVDEKGKTASLTDEGIAKCEQLLHIDNLFDPQSIGVQHHVLQSLKAHTIYHKDVDYIINEGKVVLVDEFTGRLMTGRRLSDGLHQAIEAKEGMKVESENQTLASITFQNYFRLYNKLSGMTGTADTEAVEFHEIYNLQVVSIPTNKPMIRQDMPDVIYRTRAEKYDAITQEVLELHTKGQPVLVGTVSIESSELLSSLFKKARIPHSVLNAKQHEQEASIVAEAGQRGKVTIATNIAGRGTDIKLGDGIQELGGLFILGTERHESRRIDNQLRGRSGRQGDPGASRFYLSLEDDLMRMFGSEKIMGLMETLGLRDGECIENRMISRGIENAQKRVEAYNFEIRKALLDYDNVMNQQREIIYSLRREAMEQSSVQETVLEFMEDTIADIYSPVYSSNGDLTDEEKSAVMLRLVDTFNIHRFWKDEKVLPKDEDVRAGVHTILAILKADGGPIYEDVLRFFLLEEVDRCWKDQLLSMDQLKEGIGLRGYAQRDPKQEYKREGFLLFQEMLFRLRENLFRALTRLRLQRAEAAAPPAQSPEVAAQAAEAATTAGILGSDPTPIQEAGSSFALKHKKQAKKLSYSGGEGATVKPEPVKRTSPKIGRNEDCPCGSGKKHKNCCGQGK